MDERIGKLRVETVRGNLPGVKAALAQGVSVDQLFKAGEWNALMHASSLGHHEIVEYLLAQGADPNFHKELFTPLMATCASNMENEENLLKCMNHLIRYNANVNAMERHRLTPLMFACKQGHVKLVRQLVAHHALLDVKDSQGWTALFWAVSKDKLEIVEILVNAGSDKTEKDRSGGTAIMIASRKGYYKIVDLLKRGANKPHLDTSPYFHPSSDEDNNNSISNDKTSKSQESSTVNLNQHKTEFSKHMQLANEEFSRLGLQHCGLRLATLELIKEFQEKPWHHTENDDDNGHLTYVTAVKILAEFTTQMSNMHATMAFIRYRFQNFPLHQPQDKKWSYATKLRCITGEACCKSELLFLETRYLNEYLTKIDDAETVPSEVLVEKKVVDRPTGSIVTSIIVASACIIVLIWNTKTVFSF